MYQTPTQSSMQPMHLPQSKRSSALSIPVRSAHLSLDKTQAETHMIIQTAAMVAMVWLAWLLSNVERADLCRTLDSSNNSKPSKTNSIKQTFSSSSKLRKKDHLVTFMVVRTAGTIFISCTTSCPPTTSSADLVKAALVHQIATLKVTSSHSERDQQISLQPS